MKNPFIFPLLSAAAFATSQSNASNVSASVEVESSSQSEPEACQVRAWVRAQDLSPDNTSHGELRIKVPRAECAHQVASVALRLQLDEFGEFKFLKAGVVLPDVQQAANQSQPAGYEDWVGSSVMYDYQVRDDAMSDPALWTIGAEERRAWTTEATLLDSNPDFSQPVVTPFTVAVPAVNYPPSLNKYRHLDGLVSRHSFSDLSYRYIAVVTFTDGRTVDVPAGYTTFIPTVHASAAKTPFSWNTTFGEAPRCGDETPDQKKRTEDLEKCLPKAQRSTYVAEITLDEGNVVQAGLPIKGRVTVHSTSGSTTMTDISVSLRSLQHNHWAQAQAVAGGDIEFYNATSARCSHSGDRALYAESDDYSYVFTEDDDLNLRMYRSSRDNYGHLTSAHPSFDFEVSLPLETPVDFASYYSRGESLLQLSLTVLYPQEAANCAYPPEKHASLPKDEISGDDAAMTEEGLWDSYTALGKKVQVSTYHREIRLQAVVPITVVGKPSAHPIAHYLTPGLGAPVLRLGAPADAPVFPVVQPVFTQEALVNVSARLMQTGSSDPYYAMQQFMNMSRRWEQYPDPTKDYRWDNYAGLLWRKKVVAEERGVWPLRAEVTVDEGAGQQAFAT
ncbi:hypothetical protein DFH09DRAFT_164284 [Mycena vulgaris]|nr:hypothetical protein DFH09DRAFT_164284 [Mycena vulgaris]